MRTRPERLAAGRTSAALRSAIARFGVIVFGDASNKVANLERGRHVYVEGRIEISEWTGQDGKTRAGLRVSSFNAEEIAKIGRRRSASKADDDKTTKASEQAQRPAANDFHDDPLPF